MKDIRPALRALLTGNAAVQALVAGRVYPVILPQGERRPSVVFHKVTGRNDYYLPGGSNGLVQHLIQFDCIADDSDVATTLARAVHDAINGFKGQVSHGSNSPQDSVTINGIFKTNSTDIYEEAVKLFKVAEDYNVWYQEN